MVFFAQSRVIYFLFHYFNLCMPIKNKAKQTNKKPTKQTKNSPSEGLIQIVFQGSLWMPDPQNSKPSLDRALENI